MVPGSATAKPGTERGEAVGFDRENTSPLDVPWFLRLCATHPCFLRDMRQRGFSFMSPSTIENCPRWISSGHGRIKQRHQTPTARLDGRNTRLNDELRQGSCPPSMIPQSGGGGGADHPVIPTRPHSHQLPCRRPVTQPCLVVPNLIPRGPGKWIPEGVADRGFGDRFWADGIMEMEMEMPRGRLVES
jgi:hypothetical protein